MATRKKSAPKGRGGQSGGVENELVDEARSISRYHARETRSTDRLSPHLHDAYEWIASAGEWEDALSSPEQYASDAAANAAEHGHSDITESDLLDVIEWFSGQRKRNSHARETRSTDRLSPRLHDAYEWIASAGEWEDALSSPEQYASDAAANAAEHGHSDITESDLLDVIEWFSGQRKRNSHAREHAVHAPPLGFRPGDRAWELTTKGKRALDQHTHTVSAQTQTVQAPRGPRYSAHQSEDNAQDFKNSNRFSRNQFGGGEQGESLAHAALLKHESLLRPGTSIRVYRGHPAGMIGTIESGEIVGGRSVVVIDADGLRRTIETRNLELYPDSTASKTRETRRSAHHNPRKR